MDRERLRYLYKDVVGPRVTLIMYTHAYLLGDIDMPLRV